MVSPQAENPAELSLHARPGVRRTGSISVPTVTPTHTFVLGLLGFVAALGLFAGCRDSDECAAGQVRCNGNSAEYCDLPSSDSGTLRWITSDCGDGVCKLSNDSDSPHPFCATTANPDPRCEAKGEFEFCEGNQVMGCHQGYIEHTVNCTTGDSFGPPYRMSPSTTGFCVSQDGAALCAASTEPDPACPKDTVATATSAPMRIVCSGEKRLNCFYGWVAFAESCPMGGTCVPHEYPFCALTKTSEPECPIDAAEASFCRNGVTEHCRYGWITWEDRCEAGTKCTMSPAGYAICSPT